MSLTLTTPDTAVAVLTLFGVVALLTPWYLQALWLLAAALVEAWYVLDAEYDRNHGDGW